MSNNSESDKSLSTLIEEIKLELLGYINSKGRLIKLDLYEKSGILASAMGYGLIVLSILAVFIFFLFIGLAFFIGELLNSLAAGFGIMALFSLLLLLIVFLSRKMIKNAILNFTITFIRKLEANDEE